MQLDSQTVIDMVKGSTGHLSNLVLDCRQLLQHAWEVRIEHVYCEGNAAANALAKSSSALEGSSVQYLLSLFVLWSLSMLGVCPTLSLFCSLLSC